MEEVKVKQELTKNEEAIIKQEIIEETKIKEHPIHNQPRPDMLWLCGNPKPSSLKKFLQDDQGEENKRGQ